MIKRFFLFFLIALLTTGCGDNPLNNPYPVGDASKNILYSSFSSRPKHLDPTSSYSSNEILFNMQVYEPPLQYHFLKRPYQLIPLAASEMPKVTFYDKNDQPLPKTTPADEIAYSLYTITISKGVKYQPHPAFAKNEQGHYLYHHLTENDLHDKFELSDFKQQGSRELVAADYVYQLKRLAHPKIHSPLLGMMTEIIVGLEDYAKQLKVVYQKQIDKNAKKVFFFDLSQHDFEGVTLLGRYRYQIKVKGKYPQFIYWLAMSFFAAMPKEAEQFFNQPGMNEKNLSLDWYPVGTGPYMMAENNPNRRMVLVKNPNFHGEKYPLQGEESDEKRGFLNDTGKSLPFIEKAIYVLEKESIPYWNKFLQGYYDASGVSSDSFDQAIKVSTDGHIGLSSEMKNKGMELNTAVKSSTYYFGFNMLDSVVGGYSDKQRKLRQAISIAIDYEEHVSIFSNGRGIAAQSPLPPGIFGYVEGEKGINSVVYDWVNGRPQRKSIDEAKKLLIASGYPNGVSEKTGKPLILHFDATGSGPEDKARLDWMRKQFKKLNIQLIIRSTTYNRFQEKMREGKIQMFTWGWNADYPDPENFLFLLYGGNSKTKFKGENASNYMSKEFDELFDKMKNMDNGDERLAIIQQCLDVLRKDAPWAWGYHPKSFALHHQWYFNGKPNLMANNTLKYKRIAPVVRQTLRHSWNQPNWFPVILVLVILMFSLIPAIMSYRKRELKSN